MIPDFDVTAVKEASDAIDALQTFFNNDSSEEFDAKFKQEHGAPPDLTRGIVWDSLIR